ncbi:MAG: hypothetical protein MJ250_02965 [Alphaproteobacteria bacterium]|nr:hypothetical protein [Alphaproteobacteria bacterium]
MSEGTISFPKFVLPPVSLASNTVYVPEVPVELSSLPFATVLPAVLKPTDDLPILSITLETGEQIEIPVNVAFKSKEPVPLTIRTLPPENGRGFAFKIISQIANLGVKTPSAFTTTQTTTPSVKTQQTQKVQPNVAQAYTPQTNDDVKTGRIEKKAFTPIKMSAFVIKSVPAPLTNLLPELSSHSKAQAGMKLDVEVIPIDKDEYIASLNQSEQENFIQAENEKVSVQNQQQPVRNMPKNSFVQNGQQQLRTQQSQFGNVENRSGQKLDISLSPGAKADFNPIKDDVFLMLKSLTPAGQEGEMNYDLPPRQNQSNQMMRGDAEQVLKTGTEQVKQKMTSEVVSSVKIQNQTAKTPVSSNIQNTTPVINNTLFESQKTYQGLIYRPTEQCVPLIATKAGVMVIDAHIALPHLTPVQIVVKDVISPQIIPDLPDIDMPTPFKNTWSVLTQALSIMEKNDSFQAEGMKVVLPQISPRLPVLMMNFIQASENNLPFSAWFGQANVDLLKSIPGGDAVLRRLEKDFSSGTKKAIDKQNAVWKGWDIPFLSGNIVEPVSLYLQRPNGGYDPTKKEKIHPAGVRFVIDLSLSKLGKIQMEGLSNRQNKSFDLTLRYEKKLPDDFEAHVQKIFTQVLTAFEYSGKMGMKQTSDFIEFSPEQKEFTPGTWA